MAVGREQKGCFIQGTLRHIPQEASFPHPFPLENLLLLQEPQAPLCTWEDLYQMKAAFDGRG